MALFRKFLNDIFRTQQKIPSWVEAALKEADLKVKL